MDPNPVDPDLVRIRVLSRSGLDPDQVRSGSSGSEPEPELVWSWRCELLYLSVVHDKVYSKCSMVRLVSFRVTLMSIPLAVAVLLSVEIYDRCSL
jgi:hypothetical protein